MTGRSEEELGHMRLGFTVGIKLLAISLDNKAVDSGARAGLGPRELADVEAVGRREFMLDVVVVDVMQVLMTGCMIPVGFKPT